MKHQKQRNPARGEASNVIYLAGKDSLKNSKYFPRYKVPMLPIPVDGYFSWEGRL